MAAISLVVAATGAASLLSQPALSSAPAAISQHVAGAEPRSATTSPNGPDGLGPLPAPRTVPTSTPTAEGVDTRDLVAETSRAKGPIEVTAPTDAAKPFETVRIRGSYSGGGDTFVEVQRWVDGNWQTFPVPAKSDRAGQFTAFVELGRPDRYRLRIRDPRSGLTSDPFQLLIRASGS